MGHITGSRAITYDTNRVLYWIEAREGTRGHKNPHGKGR
jgi:hypothetical protein